MEIVSHLHAPTALPPGVLWIRRSNDKNGLYLTTKLLNGVDGFLYKLKNLDIINFGNGISASRPDRITPNTLLIRLSSDKNGVNPTTHLLKCVAQVYINMKELDIINIGSCIAASRPDRITTGTVWIRRSNDKNGVYPTTQFLNGVASVSIKMKKFDILIMENVSQLQGPTALRPVLIG
jgi:hypothetical protein